MNIGISIDQEIAKSSFAAVSELMVCCGFGALATKRGILDKNSLGALTKVVVNLFLPALLLSNVASTVSKEASAGLFSLPLFAVSQITLGLLLCRVILKVMKIDSRSEAGRQIQINTAFANSGVLPILFVSTLFRNHTDPTLLPRAIAYISLFLMGWSPVFWTVGFEILTGGKAKPSKKDTNGPIEGNLMQQIQQRMPPSLKRVFSPPIMGAMCGLVIGLCPPLQMLFLQPGAPLRPVFSGLETFAKSYSSTALLVLAGSLALKEEAPPPGVVCGREEQMGPSLRKQVAIVAFFRFVLFPAVVTALAALATTAAPPVGGVLGRLWPGGAPLWRPEPLVYFLVLMESCMPSAQNSVLMLNLTGDRDGATRLARFLFLIYVLSSIPISLWLTIFMQKAQL